MGTVKLATGDIDWNVIRDQAASAELAADVTDALVLLARLKLGDMLDETGARGYCPYCFTDEHTLSDCPIAALEAASVAPDIEAD